MLLDFPMQKLKIYLRGNFRELAIPNRYYEYGTHHTGQPSSTC